PAPIHILPHVWFRNVWSWHEETPRFALTRCGDAAVHTHHPSLGDRWWYVRASQVGTPALLFTENETNVERLYGMPNRTAHVKDGFQDAVVDGRADRVDSTSGSKAAAHCHAVVEPGGTFSVEVRLSSRAQTRPFARFDAVFADRIREADEFYDAIHAPHL